MMIIIYALIPVCCGMLGFILGREAKIARLSSIDRRLRYGGTIIL